MYYQHKIYFGICYPNEFAKDVLDICIGHPRFAKLAEESEMRIGRNLFYIDDAADSNNTYFKYIAVNGMTINNPDSDNPGSTVINIEPSELEKKESKNKEAISAILDLYDLLIKEFKSRGTPFERISHGWFMFPLQIYKEE